MILDIAPVQKKLITDRVKYYHYSRFPIPDSRFPIPDSRFPIPDSRFPIPVTYKQKSAPQTESALFEFNQLSQIYISR
ncbi:MAG: hypothetical protein F6J98_00095 [Moorea sp. SIO4G2]|nr:hypothetical protein [Moorena sp. SIO4G2]